MAPVAAAVAPALEVDDDDLMALIARDLAGKSSQTSSSPTASASGAPEAEGAPAEAKPKAPPKKKKSGLKPSVKTRNQVLPRGRGWEGGVGVCGQVLFAGVSVLFDVAFWSRGS